MLPLLIVATAALDPTSQARAFVSRVLPATEIPGLAVSVVKDGRTVLSEGFGVAKPDGTKVDGETLFMIGSGTKTFIAVGIADFVDQGVVGWDTPVREVLPAFEAKNSSLRADIAALTQANDELTKEHHGLTDGPTPLQAAQQSNADYRSDQARALALVTHPVPSLSCSGAAQSSRERAAVQSSRAMRLGRRALLASFSPVRGERSCFSRYFSTALRSYV